MKNADAYKTCISNANLADTGFSYTLSLINGKYKMTILYTLMSFGVVRFNEMKKYIGKSPTKPSAPHSRSWRPTSWSTGKNTPRSRPRWNTVLRSAANL